MEIKRVNFTENNKPFFFNSNGNPNLGYDIMYWNMSASQQIMQCVGEYWPEKQIKVDDDLVRDNSTMVKYKFYIISPTLKKSMNTTLD